MAKNHNYTGEEFNHNESAMLAWGGSIGDKPCTVKRWTKAYGGWWYVQLNNGGMHYTQRLVTKKGERWWDL